MAFKTEALAGVEVSVSKDAIKVKGKKGAIEKKFNHSIISINVKDNIVTIEPKNELKKTAAYAGAINAHIKNMIQGVTEGFTYKMKIVFEHFPINASTQSNIFVIKNFMGEKVPRKADILENVKVEIKGQEVILTGIDIEKVGQTAANIEQATRIRKKDIRVFHDGIFIAEKGVI